MRYIYETEQWPNFFWDDNAIIQLLSSVRHKQGLLIGQLKVLGFNYQNSAMLETLTQDILKTTEIEGEVLNPEQVRSSLARRLGIELPKEVQSGRDVDGIVDLILDAVRSFDEPLTKERLFGWHGALFPTGRSGLYTVRVGCLRDDAKGPMQVVSGAVGKEKVHFQAPEAGVLEKEMESFLKWLNSNVEFDPIIKAAIGHFWFITLHPFEDGNGRIARAIADMLLARSDGIPRRFYSMSAQIMEERKNYYTTLEKAQKGSCDITEWIVWFLSCLDNALSASQGLLEKVLYKYKFWQEYEEVPLNNRQKSMLNKLLDGFVGKLTSSKWAKINKCSTDTALRDIQDCLDKGILEKQPGGGRSTSYALVPLPSCGE